MTAFQSAGIVRGPRAISVRRLPLRGESFSVAMACTDLLDLRWTNYTPEILGR